MNYNKARSILLPHRSALPPWPSAVEHILDREHVRVVGPKRALLNVERPFQQRPPDLLVALGRGGDLKSNPEFEPEAN